MFSWHTFWASAAGATIPLIPIYIFGFRQVIAAKDATISQLRERVEQLKAECAPSVILEKRALIADIEARAKEKLEADAQMEQEAASVVRQTQEVNAHLKERINELHAGIKSIPEALTDRIARTSQVAILRGRVSLVRVRYWLSGLAGDTNEPIVKSLHAFLDREQRELAELQQRIRDEHYELAIEDFATKQEDMDHLREQARAEKSTVESTSIASNVKIVWSQPDEKTPKIN